MKHCGALFASTLVVGALSSGSAEPCTWRTLSTPASFVQDEMYAGKIALRPNGSASQFIFVIDDCFEVRSPASGVLEFIISNAVQPQSETDTASFVHLLVTRRQQDPQRERLTIYRNEAWKRNAVPAQLIDDQALPMTIQEFIAIHKTMTADNPGDERIAAYGTRWHALPDGGLFSSFAHSAEIIAVNEAISDDAQTKVSNRLIRFQYNANGLKGVPFKVYTNGTDDIEIRASSPNRPEFSQLVRVRVVR